MSNIWDIIIVGGGPGGLSAAMYGARSKLRTLLIEKAKPGGQAASTQDMENYPGFAKGTTGPALMQAFADHATSFGAEIMRNEVVSIDAAQKIVYCKDGSQYQGHTIILSPGAIPRTLGVRGEQALRGKGVSYCATCDADFFTDLDIVVLGNGDAAIEESHYLTKFANSVTIVVIHDEGVLDAAPMLQERAFKNPKINFIWNSTIQEIKGDGIVEGVVLRNIKTNETTELETNGVFIYIGTIPLTDFVKGQVNLDSRGYIITDERMETSAEGVFAAGDARVTYLRQVVTAAADGAVAAVAAEKYIIEEEGFAESVLHESRPVAVAFWTPMIPKCIEIMPVIETAIAAYGTQAKLWKLDTYRNQRVAKRYGVVQQPTVLFFHQGEVVNRLGEDEITPAAIKGILDSIL
ncbi:MAG: Thioredoxin reductase [Firmicutes bacterium]|nr:Thioredoxin reductase [Bacillota bacterium]MBT9152662.1 Thioredoxin reductase [Bacillota bacterium]MBT9158164.1 Thioredoxin reductase [Bacillota bacterium]